MDTSSRRLIIVVVEPGEDPSIETDPLESFATWEMVAALERAVELLREAEFMEEVESDSDDEGGA